MMYKTQGSFPEIIQITTLFLRTTYRIINLINWTSWSRPKESSLKLFFILRPKIQYHINMKAMEKDSKVHWDWVTEGAQMIRIRDNRNRILLFKSLERSFWTEAFQWAAKFRDRIALRKLSIWEETFILLWLIICKITKISMALD